MTESVLNVLNSFAPSALQNSVLNVIVDSITSNVKVVSTTFVTIALVIQDPGAPIEKKLLLIIIISVKIGSV